MSFGCTILYDGIEITSAFGEGDTIQHQLCGLAPNGISRQRVDWGISEIRQSIMSGDWEEFCERLNDNLSCLKEHPDCPSCQCEIDPEWNKEKVLWILDLDRSKIRIKDAGY